MLESRLIEMAMLDLRRNEQAITALAKELQTESHERRLWAANIEHRLGAIEAKKPPASNGLDWEKLAPRLWWGLIAAGLAGVQVLFPEAAKTASLLFAKLSL